MQPLLMPPCIIPGQKVRAIAPSGALREWERFEQGLQVWRDRGYEVYVPPDISQSWGYLAGKDEHRCQQLIEAWNDPECVAIACVRGGYGAMRLLENFNWNDLKPQSKWIIGFSDITALLWGLATHKGIGGIHGSVLTTISQEPDWSVQQLFDWLEGNISSINLDGIGWGGGKASGILLPGNLNLATHLLATGICPQLDGVILAFEDVFEPPYKVDRMLTQWRLSGALAQIKGIALGRFSQGESASDRPSFSMEEVWRDRLIDLNIPIVVGLPFGHDGANPPLVVGAHAEIDGDGGSLRYWRSRQEQEVL